MVGYRNVGRVQRRDCHEFIRRSDGGVSEPKTRTRPQAAEFIRRSDGGVSEQLSWDRQSSQGVYQAFRWWGIGTNPTSGEILPMSLSGVPMVGYRNGWWHGDRPYREFIRRSDGGVSERPIRGERFTARSLSGVPMVGYRNGCAGREQPGAEFIRRSDGGVSELAGRGRAAPARVYQAFRWWGIGTISTRASSIGESLSGVPMVGYRNADLEGRDSHREFIRRSDGGVSERTRRTAPCRCRVYQAFRWWGIGTIFTYWCIAILSLSGVPMVGYRNGYCSTRARRVSLSGVPMVGVSERSVQA